MALLEIKDIHKSFGNLNVLNGMDLETSEESKSSVKLMTLHASKGLEFDYVFIIGINDGLIPLNSKDEAAEEEEASAEEAADPEE